MNQFVEGSQIINIKFFPSKDEYLNSSNSLNFKVLALTRKNTAFVIEISLNLETYSVASNCDFSYVLGSGFALYSFFEYSDEIYVVTFSYSEQILRFYQEKMEDLQLINTISLRDLLKNEIPLFNKIKMFIVSESLFCLALIGERRIVLLSDFLLNNISNDNITTNLKVIIKENESKIIHLNCYNDAENKGNPKFYFIDENLKIKFFDEKENETKNCNYFMGVVRLKNLLDSKYSNFKAIKIKFNYAQNYFITYIIVENKEIVMISSINMDCGKDGSYFSDLMLEKETMIFESESLEKVKKFCINCFSYVAKDPENIILVKKSCVEEKCNDCKRFSLYDL